MKVKDSERLILSLIKDDLINIKLVNGLGALGLRAEDYLLDLSDTVFELMGIKNTPHDEIVYKYYLELTKKVNAFDVSKSRRDFDALALEIYTKLLLKKLG